ncbi:unnamed protein product [Durusdinium trenchii]|uniref:Uncharacterized protein n=1 Tax=Durusdinium trenchii TaxID=1381693 RepID=A0ABP0KBV7_9DINO
MGTRCLVALGFWLATSTSAKRRFGYPGNPNCWGLGYDFFYCCEPRPVMQNSCWKDGYSFSDCCFTETEPVWGYPGNESCWDASGLDWHHCCGERSGPACWTQGRSFQSCCFRDVDAGRENEHQKSPIDRVVQYPGNPECWDYVFDFNICCNERLRAEDIMHFCWDERRTFDKCCFRAVPQGEGTGSGTYLAKLAHSASSNAKGVEEFLQLAHSILPDGQPVSDIVAGAFIPSKGGRLHIPLGIYLSPLRDLPIKLLEIGLGCGTGDVEDVSKADDFWAGFMQSENVFPPGGGMQIWQRWFRHPKAQLWSAEFDPKCVSNARKAGLKLNLLMGDQSKPETVQSWVQQAGGHFDVVIDDASHANEAIRTSFNILWPHIQPGGLYIIEDLIWNRNPRAQGQFSQTAKPFVDSIKDWIDQLLIDPFQTGVNETWRASLLEVMHKRSPESLSKTNLYRVDDPLPIGVQFINCFPGMCIIGKKVIQSTFENPYLKQPR